MSEQRAVASHLRTTEPGVGARSAASWLADRGLAGRASIDRWHAEIRLDVRDEPAPEEFDEASASRFHLEIYSEEWGVFFCHAKRSSWIRVAQIAFVHGRDDHGLLVITPPLSEVGRLLRNLERQHQLSFRRHHAAVRTNLPNGEPAIRAWLAAL